MAACAALVAARLGQGHQELQSLHAQMQAGARRPEGFLSAAGAHIGAAVHAAATARLPCKALARGQRLTQLSEQLALRLADVLGSPT